MAVRRLLALPMQDLSVFDSFVPATKRTRVSPTNIAIGIDQLQTSTALRSIYNVEHSIGSKTILIIPTPTTLNSESTSSETVRDTLTLSKPTAIVDNTLHPQPVVPSFRMFRNLTTVKEVWQEFKYGIYGNPSVEVMLKEHGRSWMNSISDVTFYNRRKKIYDYVAKAIENGKSEDDAIKELESFRVAQRLSLSSLQLNFRRLDINEESGIIILKAPVYVQWHNLTTVPEVWEEYKRGFNGNPSVESIVRQHNLTWFKSAVERNFYSLRKKIYDFIETATNIGIAAEDAVKKLEQLRLDKGWSLGDLQVIISSLSLDKENGQITSALPAYELLRNLTTVNQVWEEYKHGFNGNPSVENLLLQNGSYVFKTPSVLPYIRKRKFIYDYINNATQRGQSEIDAVNELEALRRKNKWSLNTLQMEIPSLSRNEESGELLSTEPTYHLSRNLTTVGEVWEEYKRGLYGKPSFERASSDNLASSG